jgi:hypothetical protein
MKALRRTLLITGFLLLLLAVSGLLLGYIFGDKVKAYITGELNRYLNTEISVGKVDFSILRNFPNASVVFSNVLAKDAFPSPKENKDSLFYAEKVSLIFNLKDVFTGRYTINKIALGRGVIKARVNAKGQDNFHFWKEPANTGNSSFRFSVTELVLEEMRVLYDNKKNRLLYTGTSQRLGLSIEYEKDHLMLKGRLDSRVHLLKQDTTVLLKDLPLASRVELEARGNKYILTSCEAELADNVIALNGTVLNAPAGVILDLTYRAEELVLESIQQLIPAGYFSLGPDYEIAGRISLKGVMRGLLSREKQPHMEMSFSLDEGSLRKQSQRTRITKVRLEGIFANVTPEGKKELYLSIPLIRGLLGNDSLTGSLTMRGNENPILQLTSRGSLSLDDLEEMTGRPEVKGLEGKASFSLAYNGRANDLLRFRDSSLTASVELKEARVLLNDGKGELKNISGQLSIKGGTVFFSNLALKAGSSDLMVNGRLSNVYAFADPVAGKAGFDGSVEAGVLDLGQLIEAFKPPAADTGKAAVISTRIRLKAAELEYDKFRAEKIAGTILYDEGYLELSQLSFHTLEGHVMLDGTLSAPKEDSLRLSCSADLNNINIRQLFKTCRNFNQQRLTDKNINGALSGPVILSVSFGKDFSVNERTLYAKSSITLDRGELTDFEPVLALSRFIKVSELKNIKFATLRNTIEIRDQKIIIPAMEISSNALNLTASGIHSLDNQVEYRIKLLLSQILGKKVKEQHSEFGEIENDGSGRTALYLLMKGDVREPKFYYDKAAVSQKIRSDLKTEKETLRQVFREEFKWLKKKQGTAAEPEPKEQAEAPVGKKKLKEKLKALATPLEDDEE